MNQTQEIIKSVVAVGNSAGVILPREWLKGKAKVSLVEEPLNIKKDIFEILESYLEDTIGIYIIGSYARGEQTERSDVDILVITNETNKRIEDGKYNIILISKKNVEDALKNNILPILPMIKEAKPVLNSGLLEDYGKIILTQRNLRFHIETTKSALKVVYEMIKLDREWPSNSSDTIAYSLILRLRESYIVDCIIKGKRWSNKELKNKIKKITGSLRAYEGYLRVKDNKKEREELSIGEAEKLHKYILRSIKQHEKWVEKRGLKRK